jgi:hypothetical protein
VQTQKAPRPAFQSIELDPIDERIEARAAAKGIPTLVSPDIQPIDVSQTASAMPGPSQERGTPRSRMKSSKMEFPDYLMHALKQRALDDNCSVRFLLLQALRASGFTIDDADMIEDGRRHR